MKGFLKRLCAYTVVAVMLLSMIPVLGATATESGCDLTTGELGLLKYLNIVEDSNVDMNKGFTRGEMAYAIANFMNIEPYTKDSLSYFYDVDSENAYFGYINALVDAGVFSGDGNGNFRPNDVVTFPELCKVLTVPLGFKEFGEINSYLDAARIAGIIKGVTQASPVTVGTAYEMIFNALHVGMLEGVIYGSTTEYAIKPEFTALNVYHNLKKHDGIVEGIYGTKLYDLSSQASREEIYINGKLYSYSKGEELFGYSVVFYINADDETKAPAIQYIYSDDKLNETLTIQTEDIISFDGETFWYYDENDNEKKIVINNDLDIIHNGISYPSITNEEFIPEIGSVTFIGNDGDKNYDVAKIENYEYAVVNSADAAGVVYAKYPTGVVYGEKGNDRYEISALVDGEPAHLGASLSLGSKIIVKKTINPLGKIYINIEMLTNSVVGKVTKIARDEIELGGKAYPLAKTVVTDEADKGEIKVGTTVAAYIDRGRVVMMMHETSTEYTLGYLVDAKESEGSLLDDTRVRFKIMQKGGTFMNVECADKVNVDGHWVNDPDTILNNLMIAADQTYLNASNGWPYAQFIRYKLNGEGNINHIDTLTYNVDKETSDSLQLYRSRHTGNTMNTIRYFSAYDSFYQYKNNTAYSEALEFCLDSNTARWQVPNIYKDEAEWYRPGNCIFSNGGGHYIEAYNVGDDYIADLVVYYIDAKTLPISAQDKRTTYIVKDIYTTLGDDGEPHKFIKLINDHTYIREIHKDLWNRDLNVGDMIKFSQDYSGKIMTNFVKLISIGDGLDLFDGDRIYNSDSSVSYSQLVESRLILGTITKVTDRNVFITTSIPEDIGGVGNMNGFMNYVKNNPTVFIYDAGSRNPSPMAGSISDIITYEMNPVTPDKVILHSQSGNIKYIYVLRGLER